MKPLAECLLYTFIDTAYLKGREPQEVARQLCQGGSDLIQLRAKKSAIDEIRALAELIVPITREAKVGLIINDHPDVARAVGADFCHLGQEDFFERGFRHVSKLGRGDDDPLSSANLRIGLSSHAPDQAQTAVAAAAA